MTKIGLIAGYGKFPILFAKNAIKNNVKIYTIAIKEEAFPEIEEYSYKTKWLNIGELKKAILFLKLRGVKNLVMAGKVHKKQALFSNKQKDKEIEDVLSSVKDKKDDSLLKGIVDKVEKLGFKFLDSTTFLQEYMAEAGCITKRKPTDIEEKDLKFGFELAKSVSGLDIGQSVIVKDTVILAIEAIEGTDEAIKRGAKIGGEGAVVVKVSKPNQDMRFDVPVIGEDTIDTLISNKIAVLGIEADKTLFLDKQAVIEKADNAGISIVGMKN